MPTTIYSVLINQHSIVNSKNLIRYCKFIKNRLSREDVTSGEYHHIIPRCMGGSNQKDNLIKLSYREHFVAHLLLAKSFPKHAICQALNHFKTSSSRLFAIKRKLSSENNKESVVVSHKDNPTLYKRIPYEEYLLDIDNFTHPSTGTTLVKDCDNNYFQVPIDDPRIKSRELVGIAYNMVTVVDTNGKTSQVSKNDPKYISGELISINSGHVTVKDKSGNKLRVSKNDSRYLSKELVGVCANTVTVKIKTCPKIKGFRCIPNDLNYICGYYVGISTGYGVYTNNLGEHIFTTKDDPRVLSGELYSVATDKVQGINKNGDKIYANRKDPRFISGEYSITSSMKGLISVFKDDQYKMIQSNQLQEYLNAGYIRKGRPRPRKSK